MTDLRTRVAQIRKSYLFPVGISMAVAQARSEVASVEFPFLESFDVSTPVTGTVEGFDVQVTTEYDEDIRTGEDDVTGWFVETFEPGCVLNSSGDSRHANGGKYYRPSNDTLANTYNNLRRAGMSKSVALDTYTAIVYREMLDDQERYYVSVNVTVSLAGEELAQESLCGIDVVPSQDPAPYLIDTASGLIWDAVKAARAELPAAIKRTASVVARLADNI